MDFFWETKGHALGLVAPLWGSRSQLPIEFSPHSPGKERKCPPRPSYRLWAPSSMGVCLNHPSQVPATPTECSSMEEGRAAESGDIQGTRPEIDPASGLGKPHPPDYLGLTLLSFGQVAESQAGIRTDIGLHQRTSREVWDGTPSGQLWMTSEQDPVSSTSSISKG